MESYKNLTLVGTSHIAIESVNAVNDIIKKNNPGIVAIELDKRRFYALMSKEKQKPRLKDMFTLGIRGFILNLVGAWAEQKLGKIVGVSPGADMIAAAKTAKEVGARIALIDQDILITLKRLIKKITLKEHLHFIVDLFKGIVLKKAEITFDLRKVPNERIIKKMVDQVKKRYPSVYEVLIAERNKVMAQNLYMLMHNFNDKPIIGVIGAGHEKSIIGIIKKLDRQ